MLCIKRKWLAGVVAFLMSMLAAPLWCQAIVDIDWNLVGGSGNWNNSANWNPASVPDAADEYAHVRAAAGATTVNLDVSPTIDGLSIESATATLNLQGRTLTVGADGLSNSGIVVANVDGSRVNGAITNNLGAQIRVNNNAELYFGGTTVTDNGTINVNATFNTTYLYIAADVTLSGSGQVSLSNDWDNYLRGDTNTRRLNQAAGHTIRGSGHLGGNSMLLTNNGLIEANQANPLLIDLTDGTTSLNQGTMQANGGTLQINGTSLDNTGGTIQALNASTVQVFGGSRISSGTFTTAGTGVIQVSGDSHLAAIANQGTLQVHGQVAYLEGTIANSGAIQVLSPGTTYLYVGSDVTLTGGGQVALSDSAYNYVRGDVNTRRLTNAVGQTIRGSGQLGDNNMLLTNNGLIEANQTHALYVDLTDGAGNVNAGTMQANGGTLQIHGTTLDNAGGTIQALAGSAVQVFGASRIAGGTLATAGSGVIQISGNTTVEDVSNQGNLDVPSINTAYLQGTIANSGAIRLLSVGWSTNLYLGSNVTLTGSGQVLLSDDDDNHLRGDVNTRVLTNSSDHTIRGAGRLGDNSMLLTNNGLIEANQTHALYVDLTDGAGNVNAGTMQANGGTLQIHGTTLDNTGGTIQALGTSTAQLLNAVTIIGGTLNTSIGGMVEAFTGATLRDLSNLGTLHIPNNNSPHLEGAIINSGTINIGATCTIPAGSVDGAGTTNVGGSGSSLTADRIRQGTLSVGAGALATIRTGATANDPARTGRLGSLAIAGGAAPTGTLDLNNQSLIIDYSGPIGTVLSDVTAQIRSGRNGVDGNDQARWNGKGIITTKGRQDNVARGVDTYNLGAINNGDLDLAGIGAAFTQFAGQAVDPTTVLVKYTYTGDADTNGVADADDYSYWLNGFLGTTDPSVQGWLRGDFNYDARIDADDYTQWLNSFLFAGPPLAGAGAPAPVPEPSAIALLTMGVIGLAPFVRWLRMRRGGGSPR